MLILTLKGLNSLVFLIIIIQINSICITFYIVFYAIDQKVFKVSKKSFVV